MDKSIGSETEKHIRTLCSEIASAETLTPDLHDELYTHIEDKILGYLNGEEVLSEADAFLLAREHFGDRLVVRSQLEDVHPLEATFSLYQHLAVAVMVTLGLSFVFGTTFHRVVMPIALGVLSPMKIPLDLNIVSSALLVCAQFAVLRRWKRKEDNAEPLWYQRYNIGLLVCLAGIMTVVITWMKPFPFINVQDYIAHSLNGFTVTSPMALINASFTESLCIAGTLVAWFMWCDVRENRIRRMFSVVLVFIVFYSVQLGLASTFHYNPIVQLLFTAKHTLLPVGLAWLGYWGFTRSPRQNSDPNRYIVPNR